MLASVGRGALAQSNATEATPGCTNVYVVHPRPWIGSALGFFQEVSTSLDGQPFVVRGRLLANDWGAFVACGSRLTLRLRSVSDVTSVKGPHVMEPQQTTIELRARRTVYVGAGRWRGKEIAAADAGKAMAEANEHVQRQAEHGMQPIPLAAWDWQDQRERIYGKFSRCTLEKSERCP